MKQLKIKTVLYAFIILFLNNCTTTTTKAKDPVFSTNTQNLEESLKSIVTCENINLSGKEINTNGIIKSQLEIALTNVTNPPTNDTQLISLWKHIASIIKNAMKDQNEYDTYKVIFVTVETKTNFAGTTSNRKWNGFEFKSNEL
jgi:hypothetical protein